MEITRKNTNDRLFVFIACVGATVVLGFIAGLTSGAINGYDAYVRPALTPPPAVFGVVWPLLYALMGASLFVIITQAKDEKLKRAFYVLYGVQLALNITWPFVFFSLDLLVTAALICILLDGATLALIIVAFKQNKLAGGLLVPYMAWLLFATYLNVAIAILN
jgi:tryptophan-rich sensory protein